MTKVTVHALFLGAITVCGCSSGLEFEEFASEAEGFSVKFPGTPRKQAREIRKTGEKQHIWSVETPEGAFQVFTQPKPSQTLDNFDQIMGPVIEQLGGEQRSKETFDLQGHQASQYEIEINEPKKAYVITRLMIANGRFYQVQYVGGLRQDAAPVKDYLESFKLLKD